MPEYITKEQAIDVVHEAIANIVNSDSESVNLTDLEIEIQMTITDYTDAADVAPVVHASWFGQFGLGRCSCCGFPKKLLKISCDYCPQCGARMDGGE